MSVAAAWGTKTTAGATGNGTAEMSDADNDPNGAILIALRPANVALASPLTVFYNGTFTVPAGVSCVRVQAWGGGGGGGVNDIGGSGSQGAGGGGGGGYREGTFVVAENDEIDITVGAGGPGAANIAGTSGTAGGNSTATFSGSIITANGGSAGSGGGGGGNGGTGSFTGTVYGQVANNNGGDGGDGDGDEGGGGGGSAGSAGDGGDGANLTAGTAGAGGGGAGGAGGDDGTGSSGSLPGGGGGGAGDDGGGGGNGAYGRVIITWEGLSSSTPGTITAGSPASSCASSFNPPNISGDDPAGAETWSWQSSTDGGSTWSNVGGANNASYDPGSITTTTQYRRLRSVAGECPGVSNVITYSVNTPPTAGAPTTASVCTGTSVTISGNPTGGSGTYTTHAWTITNAGGTGATNGANLTNANAETVTFSGTGLTTGTVTLQYTVTDNNGCTGTKTVVVTVNPSPITTGVTICQGGSGSLTVSSSCSIGPTSAGPNNAGTGANVTGIGNTAWANPGNITTVGSPYAAIVLGSGAPASNYLQATNYGFSIPSGATINGIQVEINRQGSINTGSIGYSDVEVRMVKNNVISGDNKASATLWPTSVGTATYGSLSDLWGLTWTPSDINNANFGVALAADHNSSSTRTGNVDYMQITVTYTINGTIEWYTVSSGGTAVQSGIPFNPVNDPEVIAAGAPYSNLTNTNTPGTYTFWAECSLYPGCRTAANFVINANPTCSVTGLDPVCASTTGHIYSAPASMTNYAWGISGNGTIPGATNAQTVSVNAGAAGTFTVSVTITDANACTSSCSKMVTVNSLPSVTCPSDLTVSVCNASFPLTGGSPSGGTYSGAGVSSGNFDPMTAGQGVHVITYTYTSGGCSNFCTFNISVASPEMDVRGMGQSIADGDASPSTADDTDFGALSVGGSLTHTFMIVNSSMLLPLNLSGSPKVTLSGSSDFSVTTQPSSPVATSNGTTTFDIQFNPTSSGTHTATVSIANDDCDENPYTFDIEGYGAIPQEITVKGNSTAITNRALTTSLADHTDFGSVSVSSGTVTRTFTIENILNGLDLVLNGVPKVTIADRDAIDFSVTVQPGSPIAGGGSLTFNVTFDPSATGLRSAILIITHNDLPENPFVFTIHGTGL